MTVSGDRQRPLHYDCWRRDAKPSGSKGRYRKFVRSISCRWRGAAISREPYDC